MKKGKPVEKLGRKAVGLKRETVMLARLPKELGIIEEVTADDRLSTCTRHPAGKREACKSWRRNLLGSAVFFVT